MSEILIIEQNPQWRQLLEQALTPEHNITYWPSGGELYTVLRDKEFELVLLDLQFKGNDSFALLATIQKSSPHIPVVALSEEERADLIVRIIKEGAFDFIVKPFSREKIQLSVQRGLENRYLKNEIDYLKRGQDVIYDFDRIIAESPLMSETIATLKKFSQTDSTILITGETGTGKSFLSGAVHYNSRRKQRPFIKINCANLPETLLESELFGHEKGAFTGANKTRVGRLEQAKNGTVFLDEIGEMSAPLQAKLLRVLEEKTFERVGGNRTIHSDVRIIAATNREPEEQVAEGQFREDLYYRLNVLRIHLPPLRERRQCVVPLAQYHLDKICRNLKKKVNGFTRQVEDIFISYHWPGNIRQLANTIERAAILQDSGAISVENVILPEMSTNVQPNNASSNEDIDPAPEFGASANTLHDHERDMILTALEESLWIQKEAARRLGITPRALNYKIRKFGITHARWRKNK